MGSILEYGHYYNVILWNKNDRTLHFPTNIFKIDLEPVNYDYLLFLMFENHFNYQIPNINALIPSVESILETNSSTILLLTPHKAPPIYNASEDEIVYSFGCKVSDFVELISVINTLKLNSSNLLFELLDMIIYGKTSIKKILIREIPIRNDFEVTTHGGDVIIPHLGDNSYLKNLVYFLEQIPGIRTFVGIDQEISPEILEIKDSNTIARFYHFEPNPIGPYVIRNRLIDESDAPFIFFQDSDDLPCSDRFNRIIDYMIKNKCQLCGSYELRLDYYNRKAQAVRFPINVIQALKAGPYHSLLHPSSAITREAFYQVGKLSEERTFANDTKFLLRSFFILDKIMNIPAFLYIRRKRPNSLTTSPDTKLDSPDRLRLLNTWNYDFEYIKNGDITMEQSSLNPIRTAVELHYRKI